MNDYPWLTLMIAVPAVGALTIACLPRNVARLAKPIALAYSLLVLLLTVGLTTAIDVRSGFFSLTERHDWIPQLGTSWALGVDGISYLLIAMAAILTPICLLAAWDDEHEPGRVKTYFALMLLLEAFMVGVFAAADVLLFYVFFEAMLIPVYFLIGMFGGEGRQRAAMKFLLFSLAGGLVMLAAVIGLYVVGPGGSQGFLIERLRDLEMSTWTERLLFLGFFIAFAIKAPMWPVHSWLPDAAGASRPATATLLVGVLDKVGTYGMIRFCLELFPDASRWATPAITVLALVSIFYGAFMAIGERDLMRLISWTSVSHFGFIVLGIFAITRTSQAGSAFYMINHGFSTAGLFLVAGMLIARRGSRMVPDFGGWQRVTPGLAGVFLIAGLSTLALPGMGSFLSEFLVITGTFQRNRWAGAIAAVGIVLAATYVLLMYKRTMTGPVPQLATPVRDITWREKVVVAPLVALFLVLGVYPKPVLDVINPSVERTLSWIGASDPAPTADATPSTPGSEH